MDATLPSKDLINAIPPGAGPLTREKVRVRARALASIEGRTPTEVLQTDYEQAKRELTGKSGLAQQEAMLDLLPETTRAIHAEKITGRQIPEVPSENDDNDGQGGSAQLAVKGGTAAEHDQILQAARIIQKHGGDEL